MIHIFTHYSGISLHGRNPHRTEDQRSIRNKRYFRYGVCKTNQKSRENMYSIFSRKTIDTGLLFAISRVLEFDFFRLYSRSNYVLQEEVQKLREENQLLKDYTTLLREQKGQ